MTNAMRQQMWRERRRQEGKVLFQAWLLPEEVERIQGALRRPEHAWPVDGEKRLAITETRGGSARTPVAQRKRIQRLRLTAKGRVQFQAWVLPEVAVHLRQVVQALRHP